MGYLVSVAECARRRRRRIAHARRCALSIEREWLCGASRARAQLADDLRAVAARVVVPFRFGPRWAGPWVRFEAQRVVDLAGLDDDSVKTGAGVRYRTADIANKHSLAAEGAITAWGLKPRSVESQARLFARAWQYEMT
jgi:hypothetical protein